MVKSRYLPATEFSAARYAYEDLSKVPEEPIILIKINMKPLEAGFKRLREIFSLNNNRTFVIVIMLVTVAVLLGIQKVNSRANNQRAQYKALQAAGLVK